MKTTITKLIMILLSITAYESHAQQQQKTISKEERKEAVKFLSETEAGLLKTISNLTEAQLTFKPAADKWSVEDCVKHIAASETNLWQMVEASLKKSANPEARSGIKAADSVLIKAVEDRSHKSKTFAALEPANSPYKTVPEALAAFKADRAKLISFVKNTQDDLRNHVSVLPIGTFDAYQLILLISAHTQRHTQQITEIMASTNFPK
ncbi:DinB family protein [Mucilaginibacter sp. JRF]|uniref:DinB family protein n=1 Tax=Mucilaginibacter sp. JRF TaxID=2780088 RepID=UPI00187F7ECC|nr:DinB family protein [Mucilaginibacter sp. JRF]MBE9583220.1 DinB family protein [Mucilaginibacter sp. JRF]